MIPADAPLLVAAALKDQHDSEASDSVREHALQSLIDHPSREVFETACRLCESPAANERKLGVRILRELGRSERPFAREAVPVLLSLVERERDSEVLVWEISALGNQHDADTLPVIWGLLNSQTRKFGMRFAAR